MRLHILLLPYDIYFHFCLYYAEDIFQSHAPVMIIIFFCHSYNAEFCA